MNYKRIFGYGLLFYLALVIAGCHSNQKQTENKDERNESAIPAYYKYFQGTIGDQKGVLQLVKYQDKTNRSGSQADHYEGIFLDQNTGRPLTLSGKKDSTGKLTLISYVHYNPVDTFVGSFPNAGAFKGIFHDTTGRQVSFSFKESYPEGTYHWKAHTLTDSLAFDSSNTRGPKARIDYVILWPSGNFSAAQKDLITDTLTQAYFGISNKINKASILLQSAADSFLANYRDAATSWKDHEMGKVSPSFNWVSMVNMDVLWNADSLISLKFTRYEFTGGAHGLESAFCTVFDLKKNKALSLKDVFKPDYEKKLQQVLEKKLRRQYDIPDNKPLNGRGGILFDKKLALTNNFYLTGKGIGFIYNPYEVAPYVVGQIELYVPFSEISDLLKK